MHTTSKPSRGSRAFSGGSNRQLPENGACGGRGGERWEGRGIDSRTSFASQLRVPRPRESPPCVPLAAALGAPAHSRPGVLAPALFSNSAGWPAASPRSYHSVPRCVPRQTALHRGPSRRQLTGSGLHCRRQRTALPSHDCAEARTAGAVRLALDGAFWRGRGMLPCTDSICSSGLRGTGTSTRDTKRAETRTASTESLSRSVIS